MGIKPGEDPSPDFILQFVGGQSLLFSLNQDPRRDRLKVAVLFFQIMMAINKRVPVVVVLMAVFQSGCVALTDEELDAKLLPISSEYFEKYMDSANRDLESDAKLWLEKFEKPSSNFGVTEQKETFAKLVEASDKLTSIYKPLCDRLEALLLEFEGRLSEDQKAKLEKAIDDYGRSFAFTAERVEHFRNTLPSEITGAQPSGSTNSSDPEGKKLSPGAIVGIVIGCLAVVGIASAFLMRTKKSSRSSKSGGKATVVSV